MRDMNAVAFAGVLAAGFLACGPAAAKEITSIATFTGQAQLDDVSGYLGPKGASYVTPFTLQFVIQEDLPGAVTQHLANMDIYSGFEPASPMLGYLGVLGQQVRFGNNFASTLDQSTVFKKEFADGTGELDYFVRSFFTNDDLEINVEVTMDVFSLTNFGVTGHDWRTPFSYAFQPGDSATGAGSFLVRYADAPTNAQFGQSFRFSLRAETLTVEAVDDGLPTPLPEPAAWALMLVGFGVAGAGLRTRRGLAPA